MDSLIYHIQLWIKPLAVSAVGVGFYALVAGALLRYEWGQYAPTRRVRSWIVLHLFSPVFAWLAYYAAYLPASGVSGMEAMGMFFMLTVTVAPLVYFICHIILGRLVLLPELSVRESMIIAATSIAIFGGAAMTITLVMGQVSGVHRRASRIDVRHAVAAESPFLQTKLIRFAMPDGETLICAYFTKKQSMARFHLDFSYGSRPKTGGITASRNYVCMCGDELHLVFIEEKNGLLPTLRCYWRIEGRTKTFVAEFVPDVSHGLERPFTVKKTGYTLQFPVPLPSSIVTPLRENDRIIDSSSSDSFCELGGCLKETVTLKVEPLSLLLRLERPGLTPSERHEYRFPLSHAGDFVAN
jgi:hypothetical protein